MLKDIRGVNISEGDTVAVTYFNYDKNRPCMEISEVTGTRVLRNEIFIDDDHEPIDLGMFEVLVLPDDYKEW